jgi:hypothetical protein
MKQHLLIAPLCVLLLSACMKDELPVPARPRGDGMIMAACMGPGYQDQIWLDLSSGTVVSTNVKTAWDLAFESAPEGWHVLLNGSRLMTAWNVGAVDMAMPMDTTGMAAGRRIDAPSGKLDSTAFGDWRGTNHVYLVDMGYGPLGEWFGIRKVRFTHVDATGYTLDMANLNGTGLQTHVVLKDPSRSFTSFHHAAGVLPIEPPHTTWDLVLTQYTHQFYEPFLPYIVTGMLSSAGVRVATFRGSSFDQLALADTLAHPFSTDRDAIGYDWKVYSFETSSYMVDPAVAYIVKDAQGFFHKLRFLDFYSDQGQVGCPRFEVLPL